MAEREGLSKTALRCFAPSGLRAIALVSDCVAISRPSVGFASLSVFAAGYIYVASGTYTDGDI